jgi:protein phosphatase
LPAREQTKLLGGDKGRLLVVADGMGGNDGGERASSLAVESLSQYVINCTHWFLRLHDQPESELLDELKLLFQHAQEKLCADSRRSVERQRMGTTLTMGYVLWPRFYLVHVGDSRCYLHRQGEHYQLTRDHTVAQRMVDAGLLREEGRAQSRLDHMLWNFLGPSVADFDPEAHRLTLQVGDSLLLCTDGLNKHTSDEELAQALESEVGAQELCSALVNQTLERGARDNVTVVLARFPNVS